ncbi:MAG: hypothetical protein WDA65_00890 [Christensenellales bacterium]
MKKLLLVAIVVMMIVTGCHKEGDSGLIEGKNANGNETSFELDYYKEIEYEEKQIFFKDVLFLKEGMMPIEIKSRLGRPNEPIHLDGNQSDLVYYLEDGGILKIGYGIWHYAYIDYGDCIVTFFGFDLIKDRVEMQKKDKYYKMVGIE